MCCLSQGTLAVLALQLARQIHFQVSLPTGPRRAEHCCWRRPLDRLLSSPLWHPPSCEFSVRGQAGWAGSFSGPGSISGHTSGKEPSSAPCLSSVQSEDGTGGGGGVGFCLPGCGPCPPSRVPPWAPLAFRGGSPTGVPAVLDPTCGSLPAPQPVWSFSAQSVISRRVLIEVLSWGCAEPLQRSA